MKRLQLLATVTTLFLVCAGAVFVHSKSQQHRIVAELLKQEHIAIQFSDGQYCESMQEAQERTWLFDTVDVVYFDVDQGSPQEFLSLIERLPSVSRVAIRYHANNSEEYRLHYQDIHKKLSAESAIVAQAFPDLEVLNWWTVSHVETDA